MDEDFGLYGMVDVETLRRRGVGVREFAEELAAAGVEVVQLRDKGGSPAGGAGVGGNLAGVFAGQCNGDE